MSLPYMQLYVADYLADTRHLTTEQHGAYLLLLMCMWRHGGRLPNEPAKLARIAGVSLRRWHLVWPEIEALFHVEADFITHGRLEREHQKAVSIIEKRSAAGKRGGAAKALKNNETALANAKQVNATPESEPDRHITTLLNGRARELYDALGEHAHQRANGNFLVLSEPINWINSGCDFDLDVLPTVQALSSRRKRITTWAFFNDAVFEARDRRLAPPPPVQSRRAAATAPPKEHRNADFIEALAEIARNDPANPAFNAQARQHHDEGAVTTTRLPDRGIGSASVVDADPAEWRIIQSGGRG